jgi:hypothetical protein
VKLRTAYLERHTLLAVKLISVSSHFGQWMEPIAKFDSTRVTIGQMLVRQYHPDSRYQSVGTECFFGVDLPSQSEEKRFSSPVFLITSMVIQVFVGDIGNDSYIEITSFHSVLGQPVGGSF